MSGRNRGGVTHCQASLHYLQALGGYGGEMSRTNTRAHGVQHEKVCVCVFKGEDTLRSVCQQTFNLNKQMCARPIYDDN